MKIEEQVVSLELAKRLKELGVKQEILFAWRYTKGRGNNSVIATHAVPEPNDFWDHYNAYNVAELGKMLPVFTSAKGTKWFHVQWYDPYLPAVMRDDIAKHRTEKSDTEANARAKMLTYLVENQIVSVSNL